MSVTLKNSQFEKTTQKSFRHLYDDLALSDVTLVSKDEELFPVHKMVLATASKVLKKLLENNKPSHLLHLDQMSEDIKLILKFIYTGTIDHSSLPKVIAMANALEMEVPHFEVEEVIPDLKIEDTHHEGSKRHTKNQYDEQMGSEGQEYEEKSESSLELSKKLCDDFSSEIGQEEDQQQEDHSFQLSENYKSQDIIQEVEGTKEAQIRCGNCSFVTQTSSKMNDHKLKFNQL